MSMTYGSHISTVFLNVFQVFETAARAAIAKKKSYVPSLKLCSLLWNFFSHSLPFLFKQFLYEKCLKCGRRIKCLNCKKYELNRMPKVYKN